MHPLSLCGVSASTGLFIMTLVTLRDLGVASPRTLFQNLNLSLYADQRIGLVASNGSGKSTLLRCVAGLAEPDTGTITLARGVRVGYVPQNLPENLRSLSLYEAVRRALPPQARNQETWRVDVALGELDTPPELHDRYLQELSGGWQRLALLARIWVTEPDILLLDEPTNHLDSDKLNVLENWIAGIAARTPMLIASHDRRFLDTCTTHTLFLRPEVSRDYAYPYSQAHELLVEDDAAQDRQYTRDLKEVGRLRRNAGSLRNIGVNSGSDLLQKKAMQLKARAEKLEETLKPVESLRRGEIRLASSSTHAKVLVALRDVTITTPIGDTLFQIDKLDIYQGDRVILLGQNGAGKTSFVRLLKRTAAESVAGSRISPSAITGFMDQGMSHLPERQTPHQLIAAHTGIGDAQATRLLASAGVDIQAQTRAIALLSPGQRARLALLKLRLETPNFYVLDEPTNHVDIPGQQRLEEELLAQGATAVIISHDRQFVRNVGTRWLAIKTGHLREYDGSEGL
ncbi:ATP-binding cassette domain-containing protein [Acetobacter senegalensis]|nr:ATP-binding cassette domain-containing protein [Acetobacter senegalensis]MCG4266701.1 ATP-binding cassette domain-containing protein [Acetobacter senegalensis]MPQ74280.1 ATP-binding cassette domain-containing protein [Acetobacter senegalensis]